MLDDAGFQDPDGDGPQTRFRLSYKTTNIDLRRRIAEALKEQLLQVGIELEIRSYEWGTFFSDVKKGNFHLYSLAWVGIRDPDIQHQIFHSASVPPNGDNRGRYANPQVDRLLDRGRVTMEPAERKRIYGAAQRLIADDLPYVPLWWRKNVIAKKSHVQGFIPYPDGDLISLKKYHCTNLRPAVARPPREFKSMKRYVIHRLLLLLPTLFGAVSLVFLLVHLIPGDPVEVMLGETASGADKQELRRALGLDQPLATQYRTFLTNLAAGDLGRSLFEQASVSEIIGARLPATLELALCAMIAALAISFPLAFLAARRPGSWYRPDGFAVFAARTVAAQFLARAAADDSVFHSARLDAGVGARRRAPRRITGAYFGPGHGGDPDAHAARQLTAGCQRRVRPNRPRQRVE